MKTFTVTEFLSKFGISVPAYIRAEWTEHRQVLKKWWFFRTTSIEKIACKGEVLEATKVEIFPSKEGFFSIEVVYKATGTAGVLVATIDRCHMSSRSDGEFAVTFSDRKIREKLEEELGKLPPRHGNFICTNCAMDTGDQDFCSGCGVPSYWSEEGGGCRLSSGFTFEL